MRIEEFGRYHQNPDHRTKEKVFFVDSRMKK